VALPVAPCTWSLQLLRDSSIDTNLIGCVALFQ
jgi:hypothetical protein